VVSSLVAVLIYLVGAPLVGGLLVGIDRRISARMQGRFGPPIVQPFYDVAKLWIKENIVVRRSQNFYMIFFLLLAVFTGVLFFAGGDLLLVIFALTLTGIFYVLGAYKASSPYSSIGAQRELLQMMAYEPMVMVVAIGMYMVTGSFRVGDIVAHPSPAIAMLPGVFVGLVYVLAIKLRKSPFDLAQSHHAHQEIVRGPTTEFSGKTLAVIEIAHWYETVIALALVYLFFAPWPWLGVLCSLAAYFFEVLTDNVFARVKWQLALSSSWIVAALLGLGNTLALALLR
jgi:ech hydrogenase subunit B